MTAQKALKQALRDVVGPSARAYGFRGTSPTWRKRNAAEDWAIVNVQSSLVSTSKHLRCVLNIAVAPEPWLRWQRLLLGRSMPKSVVEPLGLYRDRLHPTGTSEGIDGWWYVIDTESARAAATDMVAQLEAAGWPVLDQMLATGGMLDKVRRGDLGFMKRPNVAGLFAQAEALLVMNQGPSEELERSLRCALEHSTPAQKKTAVRFDEWVRGQAQTAD